MRYKLLEMVLHPDRENNFEKGLNCKIGHDDTDTDGCGDDRLR